MKTKKQLFNALLLGAVLVAGTSSTGLGQGSVHVKQVDEKSIALWATGKIGEFQVELKNDEGAILYNEKTFVDNTFAKKYNLKGFQSGNYSLQIEDAFSTKIIPILVSRNDLVVNEQEAVVFYNPVVKQRGTSVDVYSQKLSSSMKIAIYDRNSDLVYRKMFYPGDSVLHSFDLSQIEGGEYNFSIVANGQSYDHTILLKQ